MKSRKFGFFGTRRELRRTASPKSKSVLRRGLVETLEQRQLLAGDGFFYPPIGLHTAWLPPSLSYQEYASRSAAQASGGSSRGGLGSGEGSLGFLTTNESEPNNTTGSADFLSLGTSPNEYERIAVGGLLTAPVGGVGDEDYFVFNLRAGDIFDASVVGSLASGIFDLSILRANRQEIIGNNTTLTEGTYPVPESSLTTNEFGTQLAFVVPESGVYYARVSDGDSLGEFSFTTPYTLTLSVSRPVLASQPIGSMQSIFLDFDGEVLRREIFGVPGTARLSPLADFLPDWGLQPSDESRFIDKVIDIFRSKFYGSTAVSGTGGNGNYFASGTPGEFAIQILNSRDHADPWGQPNVSRIIIGGTQAELLIPTVGIAESIDVGNFDTEETAVVLLDLIEPLWGPVPRAASVPLEDILADAVASVAAHEAGHYFGAWHTLNTNASDQLMDTGGNVTGLVGVGADGIYGTPDDRDVQFGTDIYDAAASAIPFGRQNSAALIAWGLSTGRTGGGVVTGKTFLDRNVNRAFDSADAPLPSIRVYSDLNNDGGFTAGEPFTFSDANGDYRLVVTPGNHVIRQSTPAGYRVTTPLNNGHVLNVAAGAVAPNRHFGNELINLANTGFKWHDLNGNGLRDTGEPGIGGVWIYLDLDGDNRIDLGEPSTQTAADGSYRLSFPGPGTYQVREVIDPGYVQTFPGVSDDGNPLNDYEHEVVITGNPAIDALRIVNLNFGNRLTVDFGDAPASYGAASHGFVEGLRLGQLWDAEQSSRFSADALGDDLDGVDDEDGVALARPLVRGSNSNQLAVLAVNATDNTAYVNVWIDYNQDGNFNGPNEHVSVNYAIAAGTILPSTVRFAAPSTALLGDAFVRVRLSSAPNVGPSGAAAAGEAEDYRMAVVGTLELAVDDNFTVSRNAIQQTLDVLANDFRLPGETIRVVARSSSSAGGTIQIAPDGQSILYSPPAQFVGQDVFSYTYENSGGERDTATVVVDVRLVFADPLAIDDSFNLATNAIALPLNVLANDIEGPGGALSILSATQPDKGGQITIGPGGKSLLYTPPRGFGGTEFFSYLAGDGSGEQSSAKVTVHTLPGAHNNDDVLIRLIATDLSGNPISAVQQGENFKIEVQVDDLRFSSANPGVAAGVFAAYFDMLYSMQLVSTLPGAPGSNFNFAVDFADPYTAVRRGNADVPGIINEFGAVSNLTLMDNPDPLTLATVTFAARSPGIANFMPDPADDVPNSDTLLFDVPGSAVPVERIRFVGASLEIVGDGIQFPVAIDDSVPTSLSSGVASPINVMANDLRGSTGVISIVSSTNGIHGSTVIDTRGTSDPGDDRIVYTSNTGFVGSDQFTYTIADSRGIQSTATVTVRVGNPTGQTAEFRLVATDLNGQPIDEVTVGSQFLLTGFVRDLRTTGTDLGIFAAYQDILYSSNLVRPVASSTNDPNLGFQVNFGPDYNRIRRGDIRNLGIINEIGAVATLDAPTGNGEFRLFTVTMTANAVGLATFVSDPADISPLNDTLTYEPVQPVSFDKIRFGFDTLNIIAAGGSGGAGGEGYTNWANPMDVNADGFVSPIDILSIINTLNARGSGRLGNGGGGEGESRLYVDTNADGILSPIDVLFVVNYLNRRNSGNGEGEAEGEAPAVLAVNLQTPAVESADAVQVHALDPSLNLPADPLGTPTNRLVGARATDRVYGPTAHTSATDSIFGDAEDDFESLLDALAPSLEDSLKKRLLR